MYRNFQQNNHITTTTTSGGGDNITTHTTSSSNNSINFDVDENYEFAGASLKLRNSNSSENNNKILNTISGSVNNNNNNNQSSILLGSDVLSPPIPGTPNHFVKNSHSSSKNNNKNITMDGQPNGRDSNDDEFSLDSNKEVTSVDPTKPKIGSPRHFFCFRQGLFEQAVNDCITILLKPTNDVDLQGSWLLTEISHWDHEKEKIVILTAKSLLVVKFDFIALRILEHKKIHLNKIDTIVKGKLLYPSSSIVPHVEGITNGISAIFHGGLFVREPQTCPKPITTPCTSGFKIAEKLNFSKFHPIERSEVGVRLMWNNGQPIPSTVSWNPFAKDIPWKTFTNHPLHGYQEEYLSVPSSQDQIDHNRLIYSIDNFHYALIRLYSQPSTLDSSNVNRNCKFNEEPIISQNYVGLGAMIHNRNNLGFFKVRGKFSF